MSDSTLTNYNKTPGNCPYEITLHCLYIANKINDLYSEICFNSESMDRLIKEYLNPLLNKASKVCGHAVKNEDGRPQMEDFAKGFKLIHDSFLKHKNKKTFCSHMEEQCVARQLAVIEDALNGRR